MDKQTKSTVVQWILPCAIMLIVLSIMLFKFSMESKSNASDVVTKNMTANAEKSAGNFEEQLTLLESTGRPIGNLIGGLGTSSMASSGMLEYIKLAKQYSGAYEVCAFDEKGNGINSEGEKSSLTDLDYYEEASAVQDFAYIYVADDGISGQSSIVMSINASSEADVPADGSVHLLLYYSLSDFESVIRKGDFVSWDFVALIDESGTVLTVSGTESKWAQGDNIYDKLGNANSGAITRIKSRINGRLSGMSTVSIENAEEALIYVPLGINSWTVMTGISQSYIDKLLSQQWRTSKSMLIQLGVAIFAFIALIVIINIFSKFYNVKKQKQLEEKADTDLLTGLNNKLATERKIKEFIAGNPDSQSMMFVLDIDNFKKINDTMGHAFGDEVLRSLGQQIGVIFRATDIIGRAGGDEFIFFLKNVKEASDVRKEAKKVEYFFQHFQAGEYTKYSATASIGVAIFPQEGADFDSIYKAADQALYKAKKRGKNQLAFYKDEWMEEGK